MGKNPTIFGWYLPRISMGGFFHGRAVRFNGGLSTYRLGKDPDVRNCVARSLLAIYRSSVSETPPKSSALGIQRHLGWWLFCFFECQRCREVFFFSFNEGFLLFFWGWTNLERTFLLFGGVEGTFFWIARFGLWLANSRRFFAVKNHHNRKNPKHSKVMHTVKQFENSGWKSVSPIVHRRICTSKKLRWNPKWWGGLYIDASSLGPRDYLSGSRPYVFRQGEWIRLPGYEVVGV